MKPLYLTWHSRPVTYVGVNRDGDLMITCGKDGNACIGYTKTGERIGTFGTKGSEVGHQGAVAGIDITLDSQYVVTVGADMFMIIWEALTGKMLCKFDHGGFLKSCEWNQKPGEQNMIVTCNDCFKPANVDNRICIWEYDFEDEDVIQRVVIPVKCKASKVKWGPGDLTIISCDAEGSVKVYDSKEGKLWHTIDAHKMSITDMQFNFDRMMLITASRDCHAKIWSMDTYELVQDYPMERELNTAAISPLYNLNSGDEACTVQGEVPRYHILVGGGQDSMDVTTTKAQEGQFDSVLVHMITGEPLGTISGHFGPLNTLCWLADGTGFITGGEDGTVRIQHFDQEYFNPKRWD